MAETPKKFVESGSKCYTCSCKRVCHIISRVADNSQEVKQEIEEAFKAREKPRAKRCCDLKMESPTKHCFSSVLETLQRKL